MRVSYFFTTILRHAFGSISFRFNLRRIWRALR